jgi:transcriptional regulator with XRE-family HTH domain
LADPANWISEAAVNETLQGPKIGKRLRALRQERGLSMKAIAAKLSDVVGKPVHFTTVGKLETGKISVTIDWGTAFAQVLQVSLQELLSGGFSNREASIVPVFQRRAGEETRDDRLDLFSFKERVGSAVAPDVSSSAYAIFPLPLGTLIPFLETGFLYLVIDPEQRKLVDQGVYALSVQGSEKHELARFDEASLRFIPMAKDGQDRPITVGDQPFQIIGRAVFMGSNLVS